MEDGKEVGFEDCEIIWTLFIYSLPGYFCIVYSRLGSLPG